MQEILDTEEIADLYEDAQRPQTQGGARAAKVLDARMYRAAEVWAELPEFLHLRLLTWALEPALSLLWEIYAIVCEDAGYDPYDPAYSDVFCFKGQEAVAEMGMSVSQLLERISFFRHPIRLEDYSLEETWVSENAPRFSFELPSPALDAAFGGVTEYWHFLHWKGIGEPPQRVKSEESFSQRAERLASGPPGNGDAENVLTEEELVSLKDYRPERETLSEAKKRIKRMSKAFEKLLEHHFHKIEKQIQAEGWEKVSSKRARVTSRLDHYYWLYLRLEGWTNPKVVDLWSDPERLDELDKLGVPITKDIASPISSKTVSAGVSRIAHSLGIKFK